MEQGMKQQTKLKKPTSYIGKIDRKKKIYGREPVAPSKRRGKIRTIEDQLDYQVIKAESFPAGSSSRIL
jgi:hypothetical protein